MSLILCDKDQYVEELMILKTIAETLNESNDMKQMLQTTLERLLELTHLETGWIFLVGDKPEYDKMADFNLPPALAREDKKPMRCGDCLCLRMHWAGSLNEPVTIIECERLYNAIEQSWGETGNLTHHATIPLTVQGKRLGLLNVGSPGKEHFSAGELALLQSVAYQIGTAVERTRLSEQKEKQAVDSISRFIVDYYAKASKVTRYLWKINDMNKMYTAIVEQLAQSFDWPSVAMITSDENDDLHLRTFRQNGVTHNLKELVRKGSKKTSKKTGSVHRAYEEQKVVVHEGPVRILPGVQPYMYTAALPLKHHERIFQTYEMVGVLFIGRENPSFSELEIQILEVLAEHISLAIEKICLYYEWQDLLLVEERNRLARDLHDSVNQKLFSLSLLAQGVREQTLHENSDTAEAMGDIGQLAQETLTEMRTLIWQLRPSGEAKGILGSLRDYAKKLGIQLTFLMKEIPELTKQVEGTLYRIGQEALNNVSKHAGTNRAWIRMEKVGPHLYMKISDQGRGFTPSSSEQHHRSLGLTSMKERAAEIQGTLSISSEEGTGTMLTVMVPLWTEKEVVDA
ncbi:histidine kinase [Paenibacillus glucanolyticus]|uniref:GAF domain-containing sensor histidine kinase n=1 Tax=Paenibacillus TaxID=44249 RepID=UPI0003E227A7|nr:MULTISPECIES: GAF domain-containing sensor histidine kinase [Paenibacillus]ANA82267.1 histidine kinase [Paenibacillus glucanolyticus]AVV58995.1 histidine kinase [Paenibacillus glucanolyticus]ETT41692.1 two-component sensor protein yhcY [Paenibacillus sp. FSL R5-808]